VSIRGRRKGSDFSSFQDLIFSGIIRCLEHLDLGVSPSFRFDHTPEKRFALPASLFMSDSKPSLDELRIDRRESHASAGRPWRALLVMAILVFIGAAVWWGHNQKVIEVRTVIAKETGGSSSGVSERTVLNASGYVTARRAATVSSKVTGKVTEVLIEEGMKVQEGQVLAKLDDTNVKASLHLAEAQLDSSKLALAETQVRIKEAEQELERQAGLIKNKIATQADYDHAEATSLAFKARLKQQEREVTVAERQLAAWEQQLDDTIIRAPFPGIVTSKNAQPGEMISPISAGGGFTRTGIGTVVDMQSLEVEIDVNESYINRVEPGQPVEATLDAYPDWKIPCKVIAIIPTADRQKSTVKVRVGFDKLDKRILPEMGIKVAFREAVAPAGAPVSARMISLPKAAIHQQDGRDVVMVVQKSKAERRSVTVSDSNGTEAFVTAGLAAGDHVISEWPEGLTDGVEVREKQP
jgi:HlyD family secretion protein